MFADCKDNLLCTIAALELTSAFIIAPGAICKSNSASVAVLVVLRFISLPVASDALAHSSVGAVRTTAVAVPLVKVSLTVKALLLQYRLQ